MSNETRNFDSSRGLIMEKLGTDNGATVVMASLQVDIQKFIGTPDDQTAKSLGYAEFKFNRNLVCDAWKGDETIFSELSQLRLPIMEVELSPVFLQALVNFVASRVYSTQNPTLEGPSAYWYRAFESEVKKIRQSDNYNSDNIPRFKSDKGFV